MPSMRRRGAGVIVTSPTAAPAPQEATSRYESLTVPSTATLHEAAGRRGAIPSAIGPLTASHRVCGPAFTVRCPPGNNLWLHRSLYEATAGDVLVVDTGGGYEFGYWGEILAAAALKQGIAGLVIDGCVRDSARLIELGLPVFSRGLCIQGTVKDEAGDGATGQPIMIGPVRVEAGDLVVGDADGVVIIDAQSARQVVESGHKRDAVEAEILRKLSQGETTIGLLGLQSA